MRAVIAAGVLAAIVVSPARADDPDYAKARQLYNAANAEMDAGKFDDAARDFGAAYEITKDPVLFYKIGHANKRAGKCSVAVAYFKRYLLEAKHEARFVDLATEQLKECGAFDSGSGSGAGSGSGVAGSGSGSGAAGAVKPEPKPIVKRHGKNAAWIVTGIGIAFVSAGGVLAYAASSSEQDIKDLYSTPTPMTYSSTVAKKYNDSVAQGTRYEQLSWAAFGAAGVAAVAATILFGRSGSHVEPVVAPHSAGVAATFSF